MEAITNEALAAFETRLREEERSAATREKYLCSVAAFAAWLGGRPLTKEAAVGWKARLCERGYAPASVNAMLSALNNFLRGVGREDCRVKFLKVQRSVFRDPARELGREEYERLVGTARMLGRERLALLLETICGTGIRVSELRYITVEAVAAGYAAVRLKGKVRQVLLPGKLRRKLKKYAEQQKTVSGEIFLTGNGKPLSRTQIWTEMKALCKQAGVEPTKVFPHNLRHLFARIFYKACRDIVKLADVLGHSSIDTTRIYLVATGEEHARQLDRLRLVE